MMLVWRNKLEGNLNLVDRQRINVQYLKIIHLAF